MLDTSCRMYGTCSSLCFTLFFIFLVEHCLLDMLDTCCRMYVRVLVFTCFTLIFYISGGFLRTLSFRYVGHLLYNLCTCSSLNCFTLFFIFLVGEHCLLDMLDTCCIICVRVLVLIALLCFFIFLVGEHCLLDMLDTCCIICVRVLVLIALLCFLYFWWTNTAF